MKNPKIYPGILFFIAFAQGFEQMLLKDAEISSICNQILNFEFSQFIFSIQSHKIHIFIIHDSFRNISIASGTCVIRYLSVQFVWVIFCWLKYTVSQKFGQTEKNGHFWPANTFNWFCDFQFLSYRKKYFRKKKKKNKKNRKTPKFCANHIFMKYVTLGVFISAATPKE